MSLCLCPNSCKSNVNTKALHFAAAKCSALVLTLDLQLLGQRHKDIRNGLSTPPKLVPKHIYQVLTRPAWCMRMLTTKNHFFGNIVGHVDGIKDVRSLGLKI